MAAMDLLSEIWTRVSSIAQENDTFRLRLITMPILVLNEHGASLPMNLQTEVVDDGRVAPGAWEMRRHGDKTSLLLGLPARN